MQDDQFRLTPPPATVWKRAEAFNNSKRTQKALFAGSRTCKPGQTDLFDPNGTREKGDAQQ